MRGVVLGCVMAIGMSWAVEAVAQPGTDAQSGTDAQLGADAPVQGNPARQASATSNRNDSSCDDEQAVSVEAFSKTVEHHARVAELTRKLEERARAEFEAAVERHARLIALVRRLDAALEAEQQRKFEEKFERFIQKREFMERLTERRDQSPGRAPSLSR